MIARTVAIAYTLALVVVLSVPGQDLPSIAMSADTLSHVGAFFLLAGLWLLERVRGRHATLPAIAGCLAFAALSEVYQGFLPWRFGDPVDAVANVLGVAIAVALFGALVRIRKSAARNKKAAQSLE